MPHINLLSPHLADLIAAGEVVERPASVIKELMENAFDAGAEHVTVEIRNGGATMIRVTDDGCGMAPEDAGIAFLRHATSKLQDEHGLEAIRTMGFRGEALAAISAVSHITLTTRRPEDAEGTYLTLDAGDIQEMEPVGCPAGTEICVRDLFFNTPARLKFLKSDRSEASACVQAGLRCALGRPEVSVRFLRDGKEEFFTPGDGAPDACCYALLGRELTGDFLPVKISEEGLSLSGFVSSPSAGRGNRTAQYFFVNGRFIRSTLMQSALEQAYKNTLLTGRYPACVLWLTIAPGAVDVNVHPAKTEVKFSEERRIFSLVYQAAQAALQAEVRVPTLGTSQKSTVGTTTEAATVSGTAFSYGTAPGSGEAPSSRRAQAPTWSTGQSRSSTDVFVRQNGSSVSIGNLENLPGTQHPGQNLQSRWGVEPVAYREPLPGAGNDSRSSAPTQDHRVPVTSEQDYHTAETEYRDSAMTSAQEISHIPVQPGSVLREAVHDFDVVGTMTPTQDAGAEIQTSGNTASTAEQQSIPEWTQETMIPDLKPGQPPKPTAIYEIFRTYIAVEVGEEIVLIDKHAAHERMNFDRLKAHQGPLLSQQLLMPQTLRLSGEDLELLDRYGELFLEFGFELEPFGEREIILRGVPADILPSDALGALEEILERLKTGEVPDPAAARDELLHTVACKAAIKAGWLTGREELQRIADEVLSGRVRYCPHGRPVSVTVMRRDLDKLFKRIV